jgi:drug/metabolite transporter (DMT)-like permease
MSENMKTILLILISISIAISGQFCLKQGIMESSGRMSLTSVSDSVQQILSIFRSPIVLFGLMLYGLGSVAWMMVLSRADLSYAYPMLSLGYVLTTFLAHYLRGEIITPYRWVGVCLITLGVLFIGNEAWFRTLLKKFSW